MRDRILRNFLGALAAAILCCAGASAQAPATTPAPQLEQQPETPLSRTITLNKGEKQEFDFTVSELGSITIRVYQDVTATTGEESTPPGIGGVKVSIRSRDHGFEDWVIEQYTDTDGSYTFECLRPGKYKIEIDSSTLPKEFANEKP